MEHKRRVVVTGMGAVTPLGLNLATTWSGIISSQSGADYITLFDASTFPTRIAAEVKNFKFDAVKFDSSLSYLGRNTRMAITAAKEAFEDAGLKAGQLKPEELGVYLGSGEGEPDFYNFMDTLIQAFRENETRADIFLNVGKDILHPFKEWEQEPYMSSQHLARLFKAAGPNFSCLTACAAGSQAIGEAAEIIRRGEVEVMLSGGCHSMIHPFGLAGFSLLSALSTRNSEPKRASRPFDRERDGFVLGEGAGILILEELAHARKRKARIYGEILGYGSSSDAFRITDVHPDGRGAIQCMKLALRDAGVNPEDIDYINAHGTSTQINDRVESKAISAAFGRQASKLAVSSTKSMTGHLIAAAGAVELSICLLAMRDSLLPPTINYENPDPDCDLDYVPNKAREKKIKCCVSNSFGFGGQNVSLVVGRAP